MAVDTEDKRRSAATMPFLATMPVADGSLALEADRAHAAYMYRGIDFDSPPVATGPNLQPLFIKTMGRMM